MGVYRNLDNLMLIKLNNFTRQINVIEHQTVARQVEQI